MWYIYIKDTSLSNEAKLLCIENELHTLQSLIDHYVKDEQFKDLKDSESQTRNELHTFSKEIVSYFKSIKLEGVSSDLDNLKSTSIKKTKMAKKKLIPNQSINSLYKNGIINKRLFKVCKNESIEDLKTLLGLYEKHKTFTIYRNAGRVVDEKIEEMMATYELSNSLSSTTQTVTKIDANTFKSFVNNLPEKSYSLSNSIISRFYQIPEEELPLTLTKAYFTIEKERGIGKRKIKQFRSILDSYFKEYPRDIKLENHFKIILNIHNTELFSYDFELLLNNLEESTLKTIAYLMGSYKKYKFFDYLLLNKFLGFYSDSEQLTYESIVEIIRTDVGEDINLAFVRAKVNRLRQKIGVFFETISSPSFQSKAYIELDINTNNSTISITPEWVEDINAKYKVNYSKEFYRYYFKALFKDKLIDIRSEDTMIKHRKDLGLYFTTSDNYSLFQFLEPKLLEVSNTRKGTDKRVPLFEFFENYKEQINGDQLDSFKQLLSNYLEIESLPIYIENKELVFLQNWDDKRLATRIREVFLEYGKKLHYDDLINLFDLKYPGIRTSYRALKDAMYSSDLFKSVSKNNEYLLTEWDDEYITGPLKVLIQDYIREKNDAVYRYELYIELNKKRGGLTEASISQVLNEFEYFKHLGNGHYTITGVNPKSNAGFKVSIRPLYNYISALEVNRIQNDLESVIYEIQQKFPEHSYYQIMYALHYYHGLI